VNLGDKRSQELVDSIKGGRRVKAAVVTLAAAERHMNIKTGKVVAMRLLHRLLMAIKNYESLRV
jgi:hypothetical protein